MCLDSIVCKAAADWFICLCLNMVYWGYVACVTAADWLICFGLNLVCWGYIVRLLLIGRFGQMYESGRLTIELIHPVFLMFACMIYALEILSEI